MQIKTIFVNRKVMGKHNKGSDGFCFYRKNLDRYYIVLLHHPATKTRLHELGHVFKEHPKFSYGTSLEYLRQELDAEIFTYDNLGREIPYDSIMNIVRQLIKYGNRPNWIFKLIVSECEKRGRNLPQGNKSILWQGILDEYKHRKE